MKPNVLQIWIQAARPKTLAVGICPVILGTFLTIQEGTFQPLAALAALVGAMLIQIGTNFANDYFDFKKGADTEDRLGPTRATQAGWVTPSQMKTAFILAFSGAAAVGLYLVYCGGWPIVWIGVLSILAGILYTGGPWPLGYLGLGDVFAFLFFGPVAVMGTYYVQAQVWSPDAFGMGVSVGLYAMAVLAVNNLRDRKQDKLANKNTLAVRFGATFVRWEYTIAVLVAALLPGVILPMLTLVFAIPQIRKVWTLDGPDLNPVLGSTGRLLVIFTGLMVFSALLQ